MSKKNSRQPLRLSGVFYIVLYQSQSKTIDNLFAISAGNGLARSSGDCIQEHDCSADDERIEIVISGSRHIDPVGFQVSIQDIRVYLALGGDFSQVNARSGSTDLTIGAVCDRRLIDHRIPFSFGITILFAMIFWEDMVNIDVFCFVQGEVHFSTTDEVSAMVLQDQSHNALIGSTLAGLQREQTGGIEIGFLYSFGSGSVFDDPFHNANNIVHITGFVRTAVQFAKNTTPIPLLDLVFDIGNFDLIAVRKKGTQNSQRD